MDYKIYQSKYIIENQSEIVKQCHKVKENYNGDMTFEYFKYNIFSVNAGYYSFYEIYKELILLVNKLLSL